MANLMTASVVGPLGSLFEGCSVAGLSDRSLLERFTAGRNAAAETAFAALVARHGPMVLGVCRQLLGDHQHAEDAFQAVFLVLACRAHLIRNPDLLGNWLYGVSVRTARNAKVRIKRQRLSEDCPIMRHPNSNSRSATPADETLIDREEAAALHDEINRLPDPFRAPVVLCYFEGLSLDEAAQRLGCPAGTVHSRLARARNKLRRGLIRRGLVAPAAALVALFETRFASAAVSTPLCDITTRVAIRFAADQATVARAAVLAREVLRSMLVNQLKLAALVFLFLSAVATGAAYVGQTPIEDRQAGKPDQPQLAVRTDSGDHKLAPGRMFVVGRVLDPAGKPVPNAMTMVYARSKSLGDSPLLDQMEPVPIDDARADGSGRFHLDAPRISSSRHDIFDAVALAPGYGVGCVELDPDADQPAADITLRPENVVHGRLFDIQGQPVAGVTVSVSGVRPLGLSSRTLALEHSEGIATFWWANLNDFPAWPRPATTDAQGRFVMHGVGRNHRVFLTARHPRYALQAFEVETNDAPESKQVTLALSPARIIKGRLTYGDTGKPVAHAKIAVQPRAVINTIPVPFSFFETDADGRFHMNPPAADRYHIAAWPPAGQPYLIQSQNLDWPKGALEQSLDLFTPRGVAIRGRVTEEGSGEPIAGATLLFMPRAGPLGNGGSSRSSPGSTAADGLFQLGALPGPGTLFVTGPSDDYVLEAFGRLMFNNARPAVPLTYSHANEAIDFTPGLEIIDVPLTLRMGMTVKGTVLGPDGRPLRDAWILSHMIIRPGTGARDWHGGYHNTSGRDGHFEVHGLGPDASINVHFLDPQRKLGATAVFSGKSAAAGLFDVRLGPCGSARARIVGAAGKPFAGRLRLKTLTMVVNSGLKAPVADDKAGSVAAADENDLDWIDPINYERPVAADADGRVTLAALIPGATYRFTDRDGPNRAGIVRREFTVRPGEMLDLGDILIEKRQP
jgi:RNA polymerase sigma factor (sigma-70 family)